MNRLSSRQGRECFVVTVYVFTDVCSFIKALFSVSSFLACIMSSYVLVNEQRLFAFVERCHNIYLKDGAHSPP